VTPGLARVVCRDGLEAAFGQGADLLAENLGVSLAEETVRHLTEAMGQVVEGDQMDRTRWAIPANHPVPGILAVAVDGVLLHERRQWLEMKVGRVAALGPAVVVDQETGDCHPGLGPSTYCAELGSAAAFWPRLVRDALRAGLGRRVQTVVVLADGAEWIWAQARAQLQLPDVEVVEIVDFSHATEHLSAVAAAVFGPGSLRAADWLDRHRHLLRHQGVAPVQMALTARDPRTDAAIDEVRKACAYFTTHAARMNSPAFRARLFPIGSGAIESTAKHLIQARQTHAGMRWTRAGAQQVATLRALHRSARWTAFWQTLPLHRFALRRTAAPTPPVLPASASPAVARPATQPAPSPGRTHIDPTDKPWASRRHPWRHSSLNPSRSA
jgi:hypothetical protein